MKPRDLLLVGHVQTVPKGIYACHAYRHRHTLAAELPGAAMLDLTTWEALPDLPGLYCLPGEAGGMFLFNAGTGYIGYQNPRIPNLGERVLAEGCLIDSLCCWSMASGEPESFSIWTIFVSAEHGSWHSLDTFAKNTGCHRADLIFPDWASGLYTAGPGLNTVRPVSANVALEDSGFSAIWDAPGHAVWNPPFLYYSKDIFDSERQEARKGA